MKRYKKNLDNQNDIFIKQIGERQHKFFHEYRYHISQMSMEVFDTNEARQVFNMMAKDICNHVEGFFRTILKTDVSVCIKRINTTEIMNDDFDTWEIITLPRSSSTDPSRSKTDSIPVFVKDNTDFKIILTEDIGYEDWFASANLEKTIEMYEKDKLEKFRNSTENYLDKYKSVIVVPIRMKTDSISPLIKGNTSKMYHVLGFLCIDSLSTFEDKIDLFEAATYFALAFGDSIYTLFEMFLIKQINISRK